jgi:membrane-bound PQQ-dependent dehydrogenase (glucose/quinate/shikimate family)
MRELLLDYYNKFRYAIRYGAAMKRVNQTSIKAVSLFLVIPFLAFGQSTPPAALYEWRSYGADPGGMRYSSLKQISRSNVAQLQRAWTYHTGEIGLGLDKAGSRVASFECTPLVVNGVLYLSTPSNRVMALDAETGVELWQFDPQAGTSKRRFQSHRGVAYWEGPSGKGNGIEKRILFGTFDARLIALDAATGKPCPDFGNAGAVDLRKGAADNWPLSSYGVTSPPAIYKNLVIIGARAPEGASKGPSGDVRAFDARTGKLVWRFHTVPRPGAPGHNTWEGDSWRERTGVNVWSIMTIDVQRGIVFLPIGSAAYDFYGADRKGQNLYANSLVALNASTGKLVWHYQMVRHDIWDYDLPAHPNLITVRHNGRTIPAVAQVTKMGLVFVLDRRTGKPLFPVVERVTPQSKVPGEATWPTQPVPVKPPPLARHKPLTHEELNQVTPESKKNCAELFNQVVSGGLYTPPGLELTLWFPGTLGGATWSGASFDPKTGYLYINVNELGAVGAMKPQAAGAETAYRRESPWGEYARFWDQNQYPCQQPPWGTLNAINLNTGEIAWRAPLGQVDELVAEGTPPTGTPNLGGSIVTAGGLVFIGGANDSLFRAFDAQTGKELWAAKLDASGHATPITFLGRKSGRQFVVIAAGGGGYFSKTYADTLIAFALPTKP